MAQQSWSLTSWHDALRDRLVEIHFTGHGLHRKRSRYAALRKARAALIRRGWSEDAARIASRNASDEAELRIHADDKEEAV